MTSHGGIRGISLSDNMPDILRDLLFTASAKMSEEHHAEPADMDVKRSAQVERSSIDEENSIASD